MGMEGGPGGRFLNLALVWKKSFKVMRERRQTVR